MPTTAERKTTTNIELKFSDEQCELLKQAKEVLIKAYASIEEYTTEEYSIESKNGENYDNYDLYNVIRILNIFSKSFLRVKVEGDNDHEL